MGDDDDDSFEFSDDPELEALTSTSASTVSSHRVDYNALLHYVYPSNMDERVYQRVIIATAMFENTLVALPTGLGKTFIAATVMLNYYRWFPDSKIVFMAPTRPLVAQQIKACALITGIPASEMAVLIERPKAMRQALWDKHRVFFLTPQVVDNDLRNQVVLGLLMCLLVMDEAHRAKGNYAYNNVAQFMARLGTQCRVLALTATPATTLEGVQELVTNLKISKLAVRTDKLDDIVPYLQDKPLVRRRIGPLPEISQIMDLIAEAIKPILDQANARGIINVHSPLFLLKMACVEALRRLQMDTSLGPARFSATPLLKVLLMVGEAMSKLKIYGIKHFWLWFDAKDAEQKKSKGKVMREFWDHPNIDEVRQVAREVAENPKAVGHPKTTATLDELEIFFAEADDLLRVIIFTELRALALELVLAIAECQGARPHIFIGQAGAKDAAVVAAADAANPRTKRGKQPQFDNAVDSSKHVHARGMSQTVQKQVIAEFKLGKHNVLVATSIGEEGLDIGEVDLIICYDLTALPIKNIQRMGRTGRKRAGKVVLLFSGNEEAKFDRALAQYDVIQGKLESNPNLVALSPPVRMLPVGFTPEIRREFIEIGGENRVIEQADDDDEIIRLASAYLSKGIKPAKKTADKKKKQFLYPDGVPKGFQSVTDMLKQGPRKDTTDHTSPSHYSPQPRPQPSVQPSRPSPQVQPQIIVPKREPSEAMEWQPLPKRARVFDISDDELPQYTVKSQASTQPLATQADDDDDGGRDEADDEADDDDVPLGSLRDLKEDDMPLIRLRLTTPAEADDDMPLGRLTSSTYSQPSQPMKPAKAMTSPKAAPSQPQKSQALKPSTKSTIIKSTVTQKPSTMTKPAGTTALVLSLASASASSVRPSLIRKPNDDTSSDEDIFNDGLDDLLSQLLSLVLSRAIITSIPLEVPTVPPMTKRAPTDIKRIDPMLGTSVPLRMGHSQVVQGLIDLGKRFAAPEPGLGPTTSR